MEVNTKRPGTTSPDDQAHPPIHPTKRYRHQYIIRSKREEKVYEFVALHFFACCSQDAKGNIYKYENWNASAIPVYQRGDVFRPSTVVILSGETNPATPSVGG
ncbi:unnamed protein product [Peronospora belbahrii]|uniref:DNA topoisomerase n=1 Tax=Peronospora belbahrii TaxID=622444 RepID=A0ABN8D300_9STRA|nr:unnamed protein product [Peronospora belbahrii]